MHLKMPEWRQFDILLFIFRVFPGSSAEANVGHHGHGGNGNAAKEAG
jgi:hypothetical protein